MERLDGVLGFSSFLLLVLILLGVFLILHERKKKSDLMRKFKRFSKETPISQENSRTVPRMRVPASMEVILDLVGDSLKILKAFARDLSLTGFSVEASFPSKRISPDMVFRDVRVSTPINVFFVKKLILVRIEKRGKNIFLAFHIKDIAEDQFDKLKVFLQYLDGFMSQDDQAD